MLRNQIWPLIFIGVATTLLAPKSMSMQSSIPLTGIGPAQPVVGGAYSTIDSEVRNTCLKDSSAQPDQTGAGGSHSLELITSSQSLRHELGLTASASFGFGIYSGSISASYFDNYQLSKYTSYLHVMVSQYLGKTRLKNTTDVELGRGIPDPNSDPSAFYRRCGNSAFTAASTGGHYEAILRMETENEDEQSQLTAQLNGAIAGYGSAGGQTQMQNIMISNHAKTTAVQDMKGASVNYPNDDIASIIAFSQQFPTIISEHQPQNIQDNFEIMTWPQLINSITANPEPGEVFLETLADQYESITTAIGSVNYVKSYADQFSPRATVPDNLKDDLVNLAEKIKQLAKNCANDSTKCSGTIPAIPDFRFPEQLVWYPPNGSSQADFDKFVQSSDYQSVGMAPSGSTRVLEARGVSFTGR